jgi:hypothetical protein
MAGKGKSSAGSEGKSGIKAGFEGRAAGGKTMNSAVKGKAPKVAKGVGDDRWQPRRGQDK